MPGRPWTPCPAFPIVAEPERGQNFPERTHPALSQGLLAALPAGASGPLVIWGMIPQCFQRCPYLSFCSLGRGSPGDPVQNRYPLPHPGGYPVNWNAGRRFGMVVLASHQETLLVTPEGPGLRLGSLLGATKAEIL